MQTTDTHAIDQAAIRALSAHGIRFGMHNNNEAFVRDMATHGVRTHRQRHWLYKLVVRYRRQLGAGGPWLVSKCQEWIAAQAQPVADTSAPPSGPAIPSNPARSKGPQMSLFA
jgi:DNA topoisomerase IB